MDAIQMEECPSDSRKNNEERICLSNLVKETKSEQPDDLVVYAPIKLDPVPPTVDDLVQKLAELEERPLALPTDGSPTVSRFDRSTNKIFSSTRSLPDSGYESIASRPEEVEVETAQRSKGAALSVFDRPIPESAKHQFYDLKVLYSKDLLKAVYKKNVAQKDLSLKLKYLGTNESSAQLYIIVQCEAKSAKKVKKFFARSDVKEFLGNVFRIHIIEKIPRGLASMAEIMVCGRQSASARTMCGRPIMLSSGEKHAFATIGGIIKVQESPNDSPQLYGLTAAHPLVPLLGLDIGKASSSDGDASDSSDDEDNVHPDNEIIFEKWQEQDLESELQPFDIQKASFFGNVVASSVNRLANRDWSLVALDSSCWLPNLLHLDHSSEWSSELSVHLSGTHLPFRYSARVTVITSRGLQHGKLETSNSLLFSSPGTDFISTYDLKMEDDCILRPGDSGSWVTDMSSGRVFGHVASVDAFGEAFVIPLADTLDDIKKSLDAKAVGFPSENDIRNVLSAHMARDLADLDAVPSGDCSDPSWFDHSQRKDLEGATTRPLIKTFQAGKRPVSAHTDNDLFSGITSTPVVAGGNHSHLTYPKHGFEQMLRDYRSQHEYKSSQPQHTRDGRIEPLRQQHVDATQPRFTRARDTDGAQHLALTTLEGSPPRPYFTGTTLDGTTLPPDDEISVVPLLDHSASIRHHDQLASSSRSIKDRDDLVTRAKNPLVPMTFTEDMMLQHLRDADFGKVLGSMLDDVLFLRQSELRTALSFRDFASFERAEYSGASFEIYDVGIDATVKANRTSADLVGVNMANYYTGERPFEHSDGIADAPLLWESIKDINLDGTSVGRITILQEPTSLMLAAIHLTMSRHFDMTEILDHLISNTDQHRTHACLNRAFERPSSAEMSTFTAALAPELHSDKFPWYSSHLGPNLRQRTFFFVFRYYAVVGDGHSPAPWQKYDNRPSDRRVGDHIDIAECGSVVALSLGGDPQRSLGARPRRHGARAGFLFDTFSNWQLLNIQSFPDDQHTVRTEEFRHKNFYSGPYAFLELLTAEYRDAVRRTQLLHDQIIRLITPPTDFIFNPYLRDRLLFEDKHFSYIRRYFWTYNTLAVINTGIQAMIAAYTDNFTDEFWAGTDPFLWPHPGPQSPGGRAYREKMRGIRKDLGKRVAELGELLHKNERTRREIEVLRDQLVSGSSLRESRRAIDQGDNIRILTLTAMIFLPATFVTSVWGMTEFKTSPQEWSFPVTMILVTVPFILLMFSFQTRLPIFFMRSLWRPFSAIFTRWKTRTKKEVENTKIRNWIRGEDSLA